ncbi:hypothetical protein ABFS83_04G221600 [Erythranthe nasuta]
MEIVGRGGGENLDSQNLRDFLRIKEEGNQSTSSGSGGGLTLFAVLSDKRPPPPPPPLDEPMQRVNSNRTLLDIIREDQTSGLGVGGRKDARRSWRHLKDKIRLRRRGSDDVWSSSTVPIPSSDVPLNNNRRMLMMARRPSTRFNSNLDSAESTQASLRTNYRSASGRYEHLSSSPRRRLIVEEEEEHGGDTVDEVAVVSGDAAEQPVRMSLMALLEETDRQMGLERSSFVMVEDDEEVEEEDSGGASSAAANGGVGYNNCCVCMVRHKGAAFIPCGHTFCRLCSRELWVQRKHCPLCNNYILEILDIF